MRNGIGGIGGNAKLDGRNQPDDGDEVQSDFNHVDDQIGNEGVSLIRRITKTHAEIFGDDLCII